MSQSIFLKNYFFAWPILFFSEDFILLSLFFVKLSLSFFSTHNASFQNINGVSLDQNLIWQD